MIVGLALINPKDDLVTGQGRISSITIRLDVGGLLLEHPTRVQMAIVVNIIFI
jgi:hypothetical protein